MIVVLWMTYYFSKGNKVFNYAKNQFDYEIVNYVLKYGKKVEESNDYAIYCID